MSTHIIHKQKVQLQTNMPEAASALQNRLSNLLRNDLPAKLEALFDKVSPNGKILRIDKLELNLGTLNNQNLEAEFTGKLVEQLSIALSELQVNTGETRAVEVEQQQSMIDTLIYFLQYGYMPWYHASKNFSEWESAMLHSFSEKEWGQLAEELKKNSATNTSAIRRLALQFSDSFLEKILMQLHDKLNKDKVRSIVERLGEGSGALSGMPGLFWQRVITAALNTANQDDFTIELQKEINKDAIESKENKIKRKNSDAAEGIFTENCGLVILHPFLVMYFRELGLLQENAFPNMEMQHRAVLLLHYLATGETQVAEFNLLMPKLLCDVDFAEPVPNHIELTVKEQEESVNLLKAVTQHWEPLQRTSPGGLQTSFLQREGKLQQTETGWLLKVEQKTIDILLDRLPWGIRTIQLPWMKDILNVEWV